MQDGLSGTIESIKGATTEQEKTYYCKAEAFGTEKLHQNGGKQSIVVHYQWMG